MSLITNIVYFINSPEPEEDCADSDITDHETDHESSTLDYSTATATFNHFDLAGYDRKNLSDSEKLSILTTSWEIPQDYQFPSRKDGKQARRFQSAWLDKWPFLRYSVSKDGVYCSYCFVFRINDIGHLISSPLCDWKNVSSLVKKHIGSSHNSSHNMAASSADSFIRIATGTQRDVVRQISSALEKQVVRNQAILEAIIKCIVICGKQNIPLRGKTEDLSNFMVLLKFRAEVDEVLRTHLDSAPKNATYLSPNIQNEFIEICGDFIRSDIIDSCKKAKYFSVLVDETTDISTTEQVSFSVRFVDTDCTIQEEFLGFHTTTSTTGAELAALIIRSLVDYGLDPINLRGQGYDGASNMRGCYKGAKTLIQEKYPLAMYVHCKAHSLNLALVHSSTQQDMTNMLGIVQQVAVYLGASAKRLGSFKEIEVSEVDDDMPHRHTLRKFSDTRWGSRCDALSTLKAKFSSVVETLHQLDDAKAQTLLSALSSFRFIVAFIAAEHLLSYTTYLSTFIQAVNCNLLMMMKEGKVVIESLKKLRCDKAFTKLYEEAKALSTLVGTEEMMPRTVSRQNYRSNIPSTNPEDYWRRSMYYPFLDHLIEEIQSRLLSTDLEKYYSVQYLLPSSISHLDDDKVKEIYSAYSADLSCEAHFMQEVERWKIKWFEALSSSVESDTNEIQMVLQSTCEHFYPNISKVLRVFLTLPVSTATAERSFSCLRRLKTWLRSTMTESRLSGLALLHLHRNIDIDVSAVLKEWDRRGNRRILLAIQ